MKAHNSLRRLSLDAISRLAMDMARSNVHGQNSFESALEQIAVALVAIQNLLEISADLQKPISQTTEEAYDHVHSLADAIGHIPIGHNISISELQEYADIFLQNGSSFRGEDPAASKDGFGHHIKIDLPVYTGQRVVEIPAFMPPPKVQAATEQTGFDISKPVSTPSTALIKSLGRNDAGPYRDLFRVLSISYGKDPIPSGLSTISKMLETASENAAITFEIERQIAKTEGQAENGPHKTGIKNASIDISPKGSVFGNIALAKEAALESSSSQTFSSIIRSQRIISLLGETAIKGIDGWTLPSLAASIEFSSMADAAIQRCTHFSDAAALNVSINGGLKEINTFMLPHTVDSMLHSVSLLKEMKVAERTSSKTTHFHNIFNITTHIEKAKEEDLKDLGRKIGQILSDEIRQYGGIS